MFGRDPQPNVGHGCDPPPAGGARRVLCGLLPSRPGNGWIVPLMYTWSMSTSNDVFNIQQRLSVTH